MGTVKPSKGFLKGSKGLHLLWSVVLVLLKASKRVSKAFEGIQRLSMEPPKGFGGFWRHDPKYTNKYVRDTSCRVPSSVLRRATASVRKL